MIQHFIGVPVVGEDGVAWVYAQHGIVAVIRRFSTHIARGSALLAFSDNIAFLSLRLDFRFRTIGIGSSSVHKVCATASASAAAAMLVRFFASEA